MPEVEELLLLQDYRNTFSDTYKDAYGVRPRFDVSHYTLQDFKDTFNSLYATIAENNAFEKVAENLAIQQLERKIAKLIEMGAADRAAAIRWIDDAEGADGDLEYLCYKLGVPYGYFI